MESETITGTPVPEEFADTLHFLEESNKIEGVFDACSLSDAVFAWKYLIAQHEITPAVIMMMHSILMRNKPIGPLEWGSFRTQRIWVGTQEMMAWRLIPQKIMDYCTATMAPDPDWKALHVNFETIHPFTDGNGRTGRMLMNWTRIKRCGLSILTILDAEKQAYYAWFK